MKNEKKTLATTKMFLPGGGGGCKCGGEQTDVLPGGGFHGGEQTDVLPGGGFHGGEQDEQCTDDVT